MLKNTCREAYIKAANIIPPLQLHYRYYLNIVYILGASK